MFKLNLGEFTPLFDVIEDISIDKESKVIRLGPETPDSVFDGIIQVKISGHISDMLSSWKIRTVASQLPIRDQIRQILNEIKATTTVPVKLYLLGGENRWRSNVFRDMEKEFPELECVYLADMQFRDTMFLFMKNSEEPAIVRYNADEKPSRTAKESSLKISYQIHFAHKLIIRFNMPFARSVCEHLHSDVDKYGQELFLTVFSSRYGNDVIAMLTAFDNNNAASMLAESRFNVDEACENKRVPIARHDCSYQDAIAALMSKLETIEYTNAWLSNVSALTRAFNNNHGSSFVVDDFTLKIYE